MVNLFPHQQEAIDQTRGFKNVAVYHDMGLGKTFTGSEIMLNYCMDTNLIVCQKSKVLDWVNHFRNVYGFGNVYDLTDKVEFEHFFKADGHVIGVINYELAWRRKQIEKLENFTLMLDESSLIQNRQAKQTKFILKLKPEHVILLSGTPVGGKYENLWTQCHLLGWEISHDLYERQYINWKKINVGGVIHKIVDKDDPYKNIERLKAKLQEHGAVFKKTEEVVDLPEQTFQKIQVKAIKEYWKFQKNSIVTVEDQELVGDTSLTKLLYSRQLCGSFNPEKIDALKDLIESTQDRIIIFYSFNAELEKIKRICQELGRPVSEINGHIKDLTAYEQESNSVTLCQYQSGSKGLNLQKCQRIVHFTLPLSSEDYEQSKKRIHRIGQEKPCFYYIMMCQGTVEERILKTLEERKDYTDELFRKEESND